MRYECNNCTRTWRNEAELQRDCAGTLWPSLPNIARLEPGDVVPAAECPGCGAVVLPVCEAFTRQQDLQVSPLPGNVLGQIRALRSPLSMALMVSFDLNGRRFDVPVDDHEMVHAQQIAADVVAREVARVIVGYQTSGSIFSRSHRMNPWFL